MAGASQSVRRQDAAVAAAVAGGGGGHGGDWGLQGCDIPVCFPHQTLGLLTHRYRDKTIDTTYRFYHFCPLYFYSIYSPSDLLCHRWTGSCCSQLRLTGVSSIPSTGLPTVQQEELHHSLILAMILRFLWLKPTVIK